MENYNTENTTQHNVNYYKLTKEYLQKQYAKLSEKEIGILCREVIFAPENYQVAVNDKPVSIKSIRQNLANFIENDASTKNFIPYSLDASIADLIEQSSCETSSMNEYYRWMNVTSEIVSHSNSSNVTHKDLDERNGFLRMSYDREAEILLCLALYQGANNEQNKPKIDLLRFKLARLREMRSIVSNTTNHTKRKFRPTKEMIEKYKAYLQKISNEIYISFDINLNLKLNDRQSDYDDLDEKYSHLESVQAYILYVMRTYELPKADRELTQENVKDNVNESDRNNAKELSLAEIKNLTSLSRDSLEI